MNAESTVVESRRALTKKQISANRAKTQKLLQASFRRGKHNAFKKHMENNPVCQDFNGALKQGIELAMSKTRTMLDIAPTLQVLLQNGAKWGPNVTLMPSRMTPYHVICSTTGDHHEVLELMIKELGRELVNKKDLQDCTALIYAVQNANIECVKTLIANEADVNFIRCGDSYPHIFSGDITDSLGPLIDSIRLLHPDSSHSSNTMLDILDFLLDSGADVNKPCHNHQRTPAMYAADIGNVNCLEKLIQKGARLNSVDKTGRTVWMVAAQTGNVDMLKCLLEDNGVDKNSIDKKGCSVLYWTVGSGNVEAVRYLLNLGVATATYIPQEGVEACGDCGINVSRHCARDIQLNTDPGMRAIADDLPEVVRLIDEYGCQFYKHPDALIHAIRKSSVEVVDYLLHRHKYPMNYVYRCKEDALADMIPHYTFLMEACLTLSWKTIKLLLEHGADLSKPNCVENNYPDLINMAIITGHIEGIVCLIRGGINVNAKSYNPDTYDTVLPFEDAVSHNHFWAAKLLLVSGCSCGVHSLDDTRELYDRMTSKVQGLLTKWKVHENNVLPLQKRCRMVILNHLAPQADKKITELPLLPHIIKYLSIPELDGIAQMSRFFAYLDSRNKLYENVI